MPRRLSFRFLPGRSLFLLLALAALLPAAPLPAQENPPAGSPVIKVDVEIVNVTVTVRDRAGKPVAGLAREAFTLLEDGKKQDIEYFARQTDLPLTVGLVIGDGDHVGERLDMAVSANQQADTPVYAVRVYDQDFGGGGGWKDILRRPPLGGPGGAGGPGGGPGGPGGGPGGPRPGRGGKKNLQEICRRTGGAYYEISEKQTLEQIFAEIAEDLRSQYSLGYTPAADARDGFRKIRVEVRPKGLLVQSRDGYSPRK